jgi:hypothetical protein
MVALIIDIVLDLVFVEPNRRHKVPACPQRTLGELLGLLLEPGGGFAFQYLNRVRNRIFGRNGEVEVDMLLANVPGVEVEAFPFCYVLEHAFEFCLGVRVTQDLAAVLGCPYNVVVADPCCVGLLIQTSVCHSENHRWLSNIDPGDFLMGFAFKRTRRLKPAVSSINKQGELTSSPFSFIKILITE